MGDLEVSSVGEAVNAKLLVEIGSSIGLPAEVCSILLTSGWTLELKQNKPAMWVQAGPNKELRN